MNWRALIARLMPASLHRQLLLLFALLMAATITADTLFGVWIQDRLTTDVLAKQSDTLYAAADTVRAVLRTHPTPAQLPDRLAEQLSQLSNWKVLQAVAVVGDGGEILVALRRDEEGKLRTGVTPAPNGGGESVSLAWLPVQDLEKTAWVRVEFHRMALAAAPGGRLAIKSSTSLALFLLALGTLFLALRRPLAQLRRAAEFAETLDKTEGAMLPTDAASEELGQLANALNWTSLRLYDQATALTESEARKGAILGAALDCIVSFDEFGNVIEFNPSAERILGYTRAQAMQNPVVDLLVPPQDRVEGCFNLAALLAHTRGVELGKLVEMDVLRADTSLFPAEVAITAVDVSGRKLYTAYLRDITERKRAERSLAESEHRYRSVVENLQEIVFQTDRDACWTFLNPAWEEVSQYGCAESLGRPLLDFIGADDHAALQRMFAALAHGEQESASMEVRLSARDGSLRWLEMFARVLRDENGALTGFAGSAMDVSERRLAEDQLKDQLHFVQQVFEVTPVMIYVKDAEGRYLTFNRAWEEFFNTRREQWVGKNIFDLFSTEAAQFHYAKDQELLVSGGNQMFEVSVRDGRGRRRDTLYNKTLFYRADGKVAGILGTINDITERKDAERESLRAKEAAEAANQAKSDFLANMSHEIRTPMNAIIGMTELALDTPLNEEQIDYLSLVKSSADNLLTIINEILDFSKIEAGKLDLEQIAFSLRDSVGMAARTLQQRAREKGLDITVRVESEVPDGLLGDPTRLRQVLINLLSNAIKFTESGSVQVSVRAQSCGDDYAVLEFGVKDTGIGIPYEKQNVIFEAFSQADTSTTRKYGGTGLGLAICARLAAVMDGRIWVESEPGRGSTFFFTGRFGLGRTLTAPRNNPASLDQLPVLVVDDSDTNRELLLEMLRSWNMKPQGAESCMAALTALEDAEACADPFRLVLVDGQMPGQDGFDTAMLLRRHAKTEAASIMMITSGGQRGDAARCRELGISAYLTKPVVQSQLLDAIMIALNGTLDGSDPSLVTRHSLREARRHLKILLVEDNPVNQTLALRLLDKLGHRATLANNGTEAVRLAASDQFDVILMDVQMPEMGGFEATQLIREFEVEVDRHTPIIAMTAHALAGDREKCLEAGMDGYVSKPIQVPALVQALTEATQARLIEDFAPPQQAVAAGLYDRETVLMNLDGDLDLLKTVAQMFIEDIPNQLEQLSAALQAANDSTAYAVAHTIKGMVGNFSSSRALDCARDVEQYAKNGNIDMARQSLPQLQQMLAQLLAEMQVDVGTPAELAA
ncbi:MAG: PAS domain S-box protein [Rhodocyclaceae bacterium]|nr:PAS domain S-box protein [Rhodocyclaceae bacterium]